MSRVHRSAAVPVLVAFFLSATGIAHAQAPAASVPIVPAAPSSSDNLPAGLLEGEILAEGEATGGKLGVGLAVGVLTGFIGTGIGYFVIGPTPLSAEALQRSVAKSADYQLGLKTGWERKTKSRKRNAFLTGGLLGTAAWIVIYAAAQRGDDY